MPNGSVGNLSFFRGSVGADGLADRAKLFSGGSNLMAKDEFRNLGFQDDAEKITKTEGEGGKVGTRSSSSRLEELRQESGELKKKNTGKS